MVLVLSILNSRRLKIFCAKEQYEHLRMLSVALFYTPCTTESTVRQGPVVQKQVNLTRGQLKTQSQFFKSLFVNIKIFFYNRLIEVFFS